MGESEETHRFTSAANEFRSRIDARLHEVLQSAEPAILYEPIKYILKGGGKRIRPALLLLSCRALDGNLDICWDAAIAVELLHNFTLVHDDIMDRDSTRRGQPTVHTKWDTDVALLAGDGLLGLAYQALLRTQSVRLPEVTKVFTDGIVEICEGQALDLDFETRSRVSLEDYTLMIGKKTATLLGVAATMGGILANGTPAEIDALRQFAFNLGCAFQIQDDLLDIVSNEDVTGKTYGSDVMRRKQTYLLVHASSSASADSRRRLNEILRDPEIQRAEIMSVKRIFEKTGSFDAANSAIAKYLFSARRNLDLIPPTSGKQKLSSLLDFVASRNA